MTRSILPWLLLLALAACAEPVKVDQPRSEMSQRERDSTVANSGLYGAGVAKRAIGAADAEAARQAILDTLGNP